MSKTIRNLNKNRKVAIAEVDSPDGYYIELNKGWSFDPLDDNRVTIAPTVREAVEAVSSARKYDGPYTD